MMVIHLVIVLMIFLFMNLEYGVCESDYFRHSISGEYYINWKHVGLCEKSKLGSNEIQANLKMTKKNRKLEIIGNYTLLIPWDESIAANANVMILGVNSAWLPNAFRFLMAGCSQFQLFMRGNDLLRNMGMPPTCPIPKGIYIMKPYDVEKLTQGALVPKKFFYGTYMVMIEFKKYNKIVGCSSVVVEVIPLWQKKVKE